MDTVAEELEVGPEGVDAIPAEVNNFPGSVSLVTVVTITATAGTWLDMVIRQSMNNIEEDVPFAYVLGDTSGMFLAIQQWMIDHEGEYEILPYVEPPPLPPQPWSCSVEAIWSRMTDDEAEEFDGAMSTASPLRLRKQFNLATSMMSNSELFTFTRGVLIGVVTEARADEILAL